MRSRKTAEAEQGRGDGDLLRFGEGDDLLFRARLRDAMAGQNDGTLCRLNEGDRLADGARLRAKHWMGPRCRRGSGSKFEGRSGLLCILRDVDEDRAGTT